MPKYLVFDWFYSSCILVIGYTIKDNGLLDTHIKGGFGVQSDWPQLFHLVTKIEAELN